MLTTLINDILDFSKIEAGKLDLEQVEFDLTSTAEDVIELLAEKAFTKPIEMFCRVDPRLPRTVVGDGMRLRQVLLNLVGNAIKFTERGGVSLRLTAVAGGVRFEIVDTGVGIPPDRMGRLFKSFSQVDASTTRKFGGTGLGLAISKQLVELMGGAIGVDSAAGQGSTFWFELALAVAPSNSSKQRETEIDDKQPRRRVLVISNSPMVSANTVELLDDLGQMATTATWAERGNAVSADVIIADVTVEQARALQVEGTPVILLAPPAVATGDDVQHCCRAVLVKPLRRDALSRALQVATSPSATLQRNIVAPAIKRKVNGFRILLAEDTEASQIVAQEILTDAGFQCDVVDDGLKAVAAVTANRYDAVLMDCQMPELDGFEATARIRATQDPCSRIPIIALTANSSPADRDRCTAAGMDGYCGKPFNAVELLQVLNALLTKTMRPATLSIEREPIPPPVVNQTPLDLSALLRRCNNKPSLASAVLNKFDKQAADALVKLRQNLTDMDSDGLARTAHAVKGTAGLIAAEPLRLAAARLEQLGRAHELTGIESACDEVSRLIAECSAYIATSPPMTPTTVEGRTPCA